MDSYLFPFVLVVVATMVSSVTRGAADQRAVDVHVVEDDEATCGTGTGLGPLIE